MHYADDYICQMTLNYLKWQRGKRVKRPVPRVNLHFIISHQNSYRKESGNSPLVTTCDVDDESKGNEDINGLRFFGVYKKVNGQKRRVPENHLITLDLY